MKMVTATLSGSYGYFDPETEERRYYGPGIDIEIPHGLALTLGLETTGAKEGNSATVPVAELPEDFPARDLLEDAGFTTLEQVSALSEAELIAIKGIGKATANVIKQAIMEAQ